MTDTIATTVETADVHEIIGYCQTPTRLNRYGMPAATCRKEAVVYRPGYFVAYLCADCSS